MKENLEQDFIKLLDEHRNIIHKICRIYTDNLEEHNDLFQEISILFIIKLERKSAILLISPIA